MRWVWSAGQGQEQPYSPALSAEMERLYQARKRATESASTGDGEGEGDTEYRVDVGGGRHVDVARMRQVVTAETWRTRRVRRVKG